MKISPAKLDEMFALAGVSKDALHSSLRTMGAKHLKTKRMRDMWKEEVPTINYCYVVCDFVYWYVLWNAGSWKVFTCKIPSLPGITHWFIKDSLGHVIDLTADQFDNHSEIEYNSGCRTVLLQSGCVGPSRRGKLLAKLMGYSEDDWNYKGRTLDESGII